MIDIFDKSEKSRCKEQSRRVKNAGLKTHIGAVMMVIEMVMVVVVIIWGKFFFDCLVWSMENMHPQVYIQTHSKAISAYTHTHTHTIIHSCQRIHRHIHAGAYIHKLTCAHTCKLIQVCACTHTHTDACTYARTHAHKLWPSKPFYCLALIILSHIPVLLVH